MNQTATPSKTKNERRKLRRLFRDLTYLLVKITIQVKKIKAKKNPA